MLCATGLLMAQMALVSPTASDRFEGEYFSGVGHVEYLQLLDVARRMFGPDPEFQNVSMLYTPKWNGFVEGPTWDAWWIQNSYGPTYCALPFYEEPMITFLQNAQDLWFDQMGDGKTPRPFKQHSGKSFDWIVPDGCLCDAARPGWFVAKQGDGRVDIHDWGFEFTAAGALLQAELLLISRDREAIDRYLPKLERCVNFIETRRDPENDLFLVGPAANLLAPSYAGWKRPDGSYEQAYLTGLSVTYVAALDRVIELYKLVGDAGRAELHKKRRDSAHAALRQLVTDEGYFIKSLDPDGVRHGVYGAEKHGYFEASPNHDAIAFRVVDDAQAERIFAKMASIPELRPHRFVLANYPGLDDMYTEPTGLWRFGHWVNGGHWSTCEARMIMAYYRLGRYEDALGSMQQLMTFARQFRMDNPLIDCGSKVYQPKEPINLCYDSFGPPAALVRGLYEYQYGADGLTLRPHIPRGIKQVRQWFPIRFGEKRVFLTAVGSGSRIASVSVNGKIKPISGPGQESVLLPYDELPDVADVTIRMWYGAGGYGRGADVVAFNRRGRMIDIAGEESDLPADLATRAKKLREFAVALTAGGLGDTYEAAHARLAVDCISAVRARAAMLADGRIGQLPEVSQAAADQSYVDTAIRLYEGIENLLAGYADSKNEKKRQMAELWD